MVDKDYFGIVYKVTNIVNSKVYIGQTIRDIERRKQMHFNEAKRSKFYFHKALIKYGESNFYWEILEHCGSKDELDEMEFHYIKQYGSFGRNGYNLTFGGEGISGFVFSAEARKKLSESHKGRKMTDEAKRKMMANRPSKVGIGNPMYGIQSPMKGKNHTEETRNKISIKLSGKRFSDEHKMKLSEAAKIRWRMIKNGK
jgi:group I intron endonuclease